MVRPPRRGFSAGSNLPEVMMSVLIVGILAAVAAPLMRNVTNFWFQTTARSQIQRDVRVCLDNVNRFLREARMSSIQIDQKAGQPPYSRIAFSTLDTRRFTFWQENSAFMMSVSSGSQTVTTKLSSRVGYLAFSFPRTDDISIVSVAVTMQAPTYLSQQKTLQLSIQKVRVMNP